MLITLIHIIKMHGQQQRWIISPPDKKLTVPFLRGVPIKTIGNQTFQYEAETTHGKIKVVAAFKDTYEMSKGQLYPDMCEMNVLNEPEILRNLVEQYRKDEIFTYIGPTLIVVNPYRLIERHFNSKRLSQLRDALTNGSLKGLPHIYMIAGKAYQGLVYGESKQAIVISGQSGAGKTESTKYCMQMITSLSHKEKHSIQKKILACNPLLEAFGNSKTVRNDNSSRFGKYVQIFFGTDNTIKGANIISYLLQKSRVVSVAANQRTFHAFYCLCASKYLNARQPSHYAYLKQSGCYTASNIDDGAYFKDIGQSMNEIGFEKAEQDKIWSIILAILDLGNLQFDQKKHKDNQNVPCQIINRTQLPRIAKIIGITSEALQKVLLFQKKIIIKETSFKPYSESGCISNRNTLSKALYNSIFEFIIYRIELALKPNTTEKMNSINLLDIFGFQNFKQNSLEQLCINFTNQKLLKQYNKYVFENQMIILCQDGLERQIKDIKPPTNDDVIALLSDKFSIFSIINDNTSNQQYKDEDMLHGFQQSFGKQKHKLIKFDPLNRKTRFTIIHSQCQVCYNVDGFKLKNQDKVNKDIQDIYTKLFVNQNKNQIGRTLLGKFVKEIEDLVSQLSSASNHFVRCIKPNEEKMPQKVNEIYLLTQVRYLGVFETIQIRQKTFPARKPYIDFIDKFQQLYVSAKGKSGKQGAQLILKQAKAKEKDYLLGNKRVYLNKELDDRLNQQYNLFKNKKQKAIMILKAYKRYRFYKLIKLRIKIMKILSKFQQKKKKNLKHSIQQIKKKALQIKRQLQQKKLRQKQKSKETQEKLKREKQDQLKKDKQQQFKRIKKESQQSKLQLQPINIQKQQIKQESKNKENQSLKDFLHKKQTSTEGGDLDQSIIHDTGQKPYVRLVRPSQINNEEQKQGKFNESFTEGNSVYISSNTNVVFQKTVQLQLYSSKEQGDIQKLQRILSEQYKLEVSGNEEEFFSPNSSDCTFQIEDAPSEILNKIICFPAGDFFKKVLRKRTTFIGMNKDYKDVLVAKNRAMTKTLTLMEEVQQQKALKVFKVIVRIGEQAKLDNVFRLIENMIALCQSTTQQLKNQVFLQLLKQSNTSHELASIRIYQSLAVFLHIYSPDQDFVMGGLFILYQKLQDQKNSQKQEQYIRYLFKKMMRKIDNPPIIGYMPIKYQMMALMCKRQISIPVYLPVGNSVLIRVQSYDTFADIKSKVVKEFGINNTRLRSEMFRFFEIVNFQNQELEQSPLNQNQIVWDIMTYWQLAKQKYKEANSPPPAFFLMLKIVYAFEIFPDDVEGVELCFAQCYFDYFIGRIRLEFNHMAGLAACVKKIKLPNRPQSQILGSYPIWMAKKYEKEELSKAMIENIRQMQEQELDLFQMKFRFLQICDECPLAMSMAIPTQQTIKLFFKPKRLYLTEKCEVKEQFSMRNIVKWAIDKQKFVFDVKQGKSHAIFTEYAYICSQFLSEMSKILQKRT